MQSFGAFLVSWVAFSGLAAARPTEPTGTFSVATTQNSHYKPNGPLALAKAYHKFNKPLPKKLAKAVDRLSRRQSTGSVVAKPQDYDIEYLSPVQIGTPAQTVYLDFDTGSSDLWVFSSETPTNQVKGQATYKPGSSTSAKKLSGASWSIQYGDGSTSSGDVWTDTVTIGGLSVKNMAVENAKKVSRSFSDNPACSGLLGLAFSKLNTVRPTRQKTFFDMAMPNLKEHLFTANLNYHAGTLAPIVTCKPLIVRLLILSKMAHITLDTLTARSTRAPSFTQRSITARDGGHSPRPATPSVTKI